MVGPACGHRRALVAQLHVHRFGVRLYGLSAEEPFARTVARDHPEVVHALFDIAGEDAKGGFPEWLLNVSERSAGAPGRIDMPPRG